VAGRAGRAANQGRVLIQTRNPEHPALRFAQQHDVPSFLEQDYRLRQEVNYPPFCQMALIRFDGLEERVVAHEAARLARLIETSDAEVEVLGPAPAPLLRLRNRFRHRFIVRATQRQDLRKALLAIARAPQNRKVRVGIDVDPQSML
ncbi:MAG: primosomal protein N', partial [Polyangiaceae bacterium]|nr:primosomal protein N' [Polyangiaceae bacterium]